MPISTSKAAPMDNSATSSEDNDQKDISQEYETLNKKCDTVITKIKKRKQKQNKNIH